MTPHPEPFDGLSRAPDEGPVEPTDPEDRKIITLARSARVRTGAAQGACVRDTDGRTYAAASVDLAHLRLSALQVAVAMAVSSGAPGLEAAALDAEHDPIEDDLAVLGDLPGIDVAVWRSDSAGVLRSVVRL